LADEEITVGSEIDIPESTGGGDDSSNLQGAVIALAVIVALGVAAVAAVFIYIRRRK
jgi:hypothetical protein